MTMDKAEVAARMLDILGDHRRWTRCRLFAPFGRQCLYGARVVAAGLMRQYPTGELMKKFARDEYMHELAGVIREQYPRTDTSRNDRSVIIMFNDDYGTRFADIRKVLEKTAANCTQTGGSHGIENDSHDDGQEGPATG